MRCIITRGIIDSMYNFSMTLSGFSVELKNSIDVVNGMY